MSRPRHTRHGHGGRPHRSKSKTRASRFGGVGSKKNKKVKRRYEHGVGSPKKRRKRRKSSKKRRKLSFTIRYDRPGRGKARAARAARAARGSGRKRSGGKAVVRAVSVDAAVQPVAQALPRTAHVIAPLAPLDLAARAPAMAKALAAVMAMQGKI